MKIRYTPRASRNIEAIYEYLSERSPGGAAKVVAAIRGAASFIAEQPFGAEATDYQGIRMKLARHYRYKIFYRVRGDVVEIIHVRHTSRKLW